MESEWTLRDRDAATTAVRVVWNAAVFLGFLAAASTLHVVIDPNLPAYHHGESARTTILTMLFGLAIFSAPVVVAYLAVLEIAARRIRQSRLVAVALGLAGNGATVWLWWAYGGTGSTTALASFLWISYSLIVVVPDPTSRHTLERVAARIGLALSMAVLGIAVDALLSLELPVRV